MANTSAATATGSCVTPCNPFVVTDTADRASAFLCVLCEQEYSLVDNNITRLCTSSFHSSEAVAKCQACVTEGSESEFSILKENQSFPDNGIKREMGGLAAICINKGCPWKGSIRDYEHHEPSCEHQSVQCDLCGWQFKPSQLEEHKRTDCPAQPTQCEFCHEKMTQGKLQTHKDVCDNKREKCEGCGKTMTRLELVEHSDPAANLCSNPVIPCLFGCDQLITPHSSQDHLASNLESHIAGIELQVRRLQVDLKDVLASSRHVPVQSTPSPQSAPAVSQESAATSQAAATAPSPPTVTVSPAVVAKLEGDISRVEGLIRGQETKLAEMSRKINGQVTVANAAPVLPASGGSISSAALPSEGTQRQVEMLDRKITVFERISAVFKREIEKIGKQTEELVKAGQENKERVETMLRQFTPLETAVSTQKAQILDLQQKLISSEASAYDGVLVWKISNFRQRRLDSVSRITSFYSPCFFTSRTGYKACARIYLNGDGMGKGTHVSLFFVLMRGEYDGLLQWPFQQKVTLMWLDQNRRDNMVDTFRPDPTSSSFKRPTSDMNIASGCPLFMPLSTLESTTQGYVKDDVAFIKIIIDRANLD